MTELQADAVTALFMIAEVCEQHTDEHRVCDGCALYWKKNHGQSECIFWHPEMEDWMPLHIAELLNERGFAIDDFRKSLGGQHQRIIPEIDVRKVTG